MRAASSALVGDANGGRGVLPAALRPLAPGMRLSGPAYPVASEWGDNLWLHRALAAVPSGAVLAVAIRNGSRRRRGGPAGEFGYWGELMTLAALERGVAGLVIDAPVRDRAAIVEMGFAVFSRGVSPRGTRKSPSAAGSLGRPVEIAGVRIEAGDLIVGDADGAVVVASREVGAVLDRAREMALREAEIERRIRGGEDTLRILGLEAP